MVKKITTEELKELCCKGKAIQMVDARSGGMYEREHVMGAISLPFEEIDSRAETVLSKSDTVVVYCSSSKCDASSKVAGRLVELGYSDVLDLEGGIAEYKKSGFPLQGTLHQGACASFCSCCGCS